MTKPVTVLKSKHFGGYTIFVLRVNDEIRYPYGGIIIRGIHNNYSAVNDVSIHLKELYNFRSLDKILSVAKDIISLKNEGKTRVKYAGAVFGDRL